MSRRTLSPATAGGGMPRSTALSQRLARHRFMSSSLQGLVALSVFSSLLSGLLRLSDGEPVAFALKKVHGSNLYPRTKGKLSASHKESLRKRNFAGGMETLPYDGLKLGMDDSNIAVEKDAMESLATQPLLLRLDRSGRTIMPNERADGLVPWSAKGEFADGLPSAQAPLSWEEFTSRYESMDKGAELQIGNKGVMQVRRAISAERGKDDYRVIRTFTWTGSAATGGGPSSIMLIGVHETSERSRRLAARAVYEVEPSALLVQLCKERLGRHLVMPREHLEAVSNYARGFAASNPHGLRKEIHVADVINGDYEALKLWMSGLSYSSAAEEFARSAGQPGIPKVLCLGDVLKSRLELLRRKHGNQTLTEVPTLSARGKQLARGLIAMASTGHKVVLGVIDADLMSMTANWLERAGATMIAAADASDIESNRESLAADSRLGLQYKASESANSQHAAAKVSAEAARLLEFGGKASLGSFLNEEALQSLLRRRNRLAQLTRLKDLVRHTQPDKKWQVAEILYISDGEIPGPGALLQRGQKGLRFEFDRLEIPDHYLRDVGMESYAPALWRSLLKRGQAREAYETSELSWWAAGATEA
ncbi:unnamed protein product [Polarella glacialis]|uniref:Uncharacterized protein n=1 Tax=Polarella glacialis TaxID=89957 RepID=A0A813FKT8_POLGL|nr:unnamed protein product [Polarella glacialis]